MQDLEVVVFTTVVSVSAVMRSSFRQWLVLVIVSSALFLLTVDMAVLYTALPTLTRELGLSATEKLWVTNIYPLFVAGLLPCFGVWGDRIGHRSVFLLGLVVFGGGSLLCAFAENGAMLMLGRAILAVGAALMMPATLSLIRLTFTDPHQRGIALGVWAAIASAGSAIGPVLGGVLVEYWWWGAVFLLNVPIVIVAYIGGILLIEKRFIPVTKPWDGWGAVLLFTGLCCLVYAIQSIGAYQICWWEVGGAACIAISTLGLFVWRQKRVNFPLIDLQLFRNRLFSSGVVTAFFGYLAFVGVELLVTQRLQLVLVFSPSEAGLALLPIPLSAFLASLVAGWLMGRTGVVALLCGGLLLSGFASVLTIFLAQSAFSLQLFSLALLGVGVGISMPAASSAIMLNASEEDAGMAASVEEVSFELGGALGIALLGSLMHVVYTICFVLPEPLAHLSEVGEAASHSLDDTLIISGQLSLEQSHLLVAAGHTAFDAAYVWVLGIAAVILALTAAGIVYAYIRPVFGQKAA